MRPPEKKPVFDDPDAPPSAEEQALAESLRRALEVAPGNANASANAGEHDGAALLRAVALSYEPRKLDDAEHRALLENVISKAPPAGDAEGTTSAPRMGRLFRVAFGATGALAVAASVALFVASSARESEPQSASAVGAPANAPPARDEERAHLAVARSTAALFAGPSAGGADHGRASARIDRIAAARAADLRENRFARWGVK